MVQSERAPNYDDQRSQAALEQRRGGDNLRSVEEAIRAAISTQGRPFSVSDKTKCYPKALLPGFVRLELQDKGTHLGRTTILNNIEDLCGAHPSAPFVLVHDDANVEVVIERPKMREEIAKPSRSARRST